MVLREEKRRGIIYMLIFAEMPSLNNLYSTTEEGKKKGTSLTFVQRVLKST